MRFGIFNGETGRLELVLDMPKPPQSDAYPGTTVIPGDYRFGEHYLDADGGVQSAGPAPGPFYVQGGRAGWVFDRDGADRVARRRRDAALAKTDWVELPSAADRLGTDGLAAALQWRQAMRDIPQQLGYPEHIDWPVPPAGLPGAQ